MQVSNVAHNPLQWEHDCKTHILVRSPVHIVKREDIILNTIVGDILPVKVTVTLTL
jgi:hypothetical protein